MSVQIEIKDDQNLWSRYYALDDGELVDFEGVTGKRDSYLHDEIFRLMDLKNVVEELQDCAKNRGVTIAGAFSNTVILEHFVSHFLQSRC